MRTLTSSILYSLTDQMIERLKELSVTHFTQTKFGCRERGYSYTTHFYTSNKRFELGFKEVAYFMQDMHSKNFGPMSGFNEVSRFNAIDGTPEPLNY